jgi:hypothetical protein
MLLRGRAPREVVESGLRRRRPSERARNRDSNQSLRFHLRAPFQIALPERAYLDYRNTHAAEKNIEISEA